MVLDGPSEGESRSKELGSTLTKVGDFEAENALEAKRRRSRSNSDWFSNPLDRTCWILVSDSGTHPIILNGTCLDKFHVNHLGPSAGKVRMRQNMGSDLYRLLGTMATTIICEGECRHECK